MKFPIITIIFKSMKRILSKFYVKPTLSPFPPLLSYVGLGTNSPLAQERAGSYIDNNIFPYFYNKPLILGIMFVLLSCILLILLSLNIKNSVIIIENYFFFNIIKVYLINYFHHIDLFL